MRKYAEVAGGQCVPGRCMGGGPRFEFLGVHEQQRQLQSLCPQREAQYSTTKCLPSVTYNRPGLLLVRRYQCRPLPRRPRLF